MDICLIREIPVAVESKAGHCMFHHGLNFHRTGANQTANRRRGLAWHYIKTETMYLGIDDAELCTQIEYEPAPDTFRLC